MSRATPDDQLKFLLSCVRHSNNGKIDFVEVADECGVVSKGAAAKRYERLLKANGIHPNGGPTEKPPSSTSRPKSKAEIVKSAAAKRRKLEGDRYNFKVDDEDDTKPFLKSEPAELAHVKYEPDDKFHSFGFRDTTTNTPATFFPSTPMIQMGMQSSYPPQYVPLHQPVAYRFPPPSPGHSVVTQSMRRSHEHLPSSIQQQGLKTKQSSVSVSEEQIQSMFDEFCSQDMFKQPKSEHSPAQQTDATLTPIATSTADIPQLSPRALDVAITSSLKSQALGKLTSDNTPTDLPALVVHQATGKGIDDSILITD